MADRYQSKAYKEWAEEQDSEIQTRRKTGDYPVWDYVSESIGLLPEKGLAWMADKDRDASRMIGGEHVTASNIRQNLFDQMKAIAEKQHSGTPLSEAEKQVQSDWNALKSSGTVYFP